MASSYTNQIRLYESITYRLANHKEALEEHLENIRKLKEYIKLTGDTHV